MNSLTHKIVSSEEEFAEFRDAIKSAGLPDEDLNYQNQVLIAYYQDNALVGTGGLEIIDKFGLLRSVSVNQQHRNQQVGRLITSDILANAKGSNLEEVYLLTETARDFFQKLGFTQIGRDTVPDEIKSTTEFAHVCPESAACMKIKLA